MIKCTFHCDILRGLTWLSSLCMSFKFHIRAYKMALEETIFWFILCVFLVQNSCSNLVVNIKAKDGDVVQKSFFSDPEKDYVTIDFMTHGGRYVTVYIDFRLVCWLYLTWVFKASSHFSTINITFWTPAICSSRFRYLQRGITLENYFKWLGS